MIEMDNDPLVTVYIPTFNRVELLKRAVESVRRQTHTNLEIIIVDDCSNDGTELYLSEISKQDTRVKYFIKEKNSGACTSRNIAIENALGKYITGLDDDDYFLENRIENFVNNIILLDKATFLYSMNLIETKKGVRKRVLSRIVPEQVFFNDLLFINIVGNQVFTETELLKSSLFDPKLRAWQDLDVWLNLLKLNDSFGRMIENYSYIQDVSHDFIRLSNARKAKILDTYEYFVQKFEMSKNQKELLKMHMIPYGIFIKLDLFVIFKQCKNIYLFIIFGLISFLNARNFMKRK